MEAEIVEAEVIESKPLPVIHPIEAGLMVGSFFLGYIIGRNNRKKAVSRTRKLKAKSKK